MTDHYFDERAVRFANNIYGTAKGAIRLAILWRDLQQHIPWLGEQRASMQILDVGAGLGQLAIRLAQQGHEVTCVEPSNAMLQAARDNVTHAGQQRRIRFIESSLQQLPQHLQQQYDLVICHAVLEWLAQPEAAIAHLRKWLNADAYLSLMAYNLNGIVMRNLVRGNFRKVKSGEFAGDRRGLTPAHPLTPEQIEQWLAESRLEVIQQSGIRVVYDYLPRDVARERSLEDIIEMEMQFSVQAPYNRLGRYSHWLCQPLSGA
ncbi:MAG: methyltransferase domain-containing protein [Gammaproteobacteria bacterium]